QKNCRMSLTEISRTVGLSVDSVKKRIKRMIENNIFHPRIQLRPRHFGFSNIVEVKLRLHNYTNEDITEFIKYLKECPYVAEVISLSGEWDFTLIIIAKDSEHLNRISLSIREKFNKMINSWSESLSVRVYKFEVYDMVKLMDCSGNVKK
ncbi:MAG: Lrp/AsnC ligand binding domain-containing protein, partial [Candidatus Woesearchaeota archaeon]|nr:Lrp/AsnC ligand binding domain-containing protein [Candidatus Woesearchaeota archaeon]